MAKAKATEENATSQRRQVGAAMRSYRKDADMDREAAAALIGIAGPSLTRKENGDLQFSRSQIETLAEAYGVNDEELAMLVELAREARARRGSAHGEFPMFVPPKSRAYLEMERNDAIEVRLATLSLVPPYFQTEAYMRELWLRNGELLSSARIKELVKLRQARQQIVTKRDAPMIRAVIHETALRLPVGGPPVMHEQLHALAAACELPNVEIQIQPTAAGAFPSMDSTFSLLRFPVGPSGDVVQVYGQAESYYRDRQAATEPYRVVWDRLRVAALDLQASKALILDAAAHFGPDEGR